jgi:hypothetical protein
MAKQTCFECKEEIIDDLWSGLRVRGSFHSFHTQCVREIVSTHIMNILDREENITRRAAEEHDHNKKAERLGFCLRFDIKHVYHDPDNTGVCSVCVMLPSHFLHVCVRCGFDLGFHSTDTGACPTSTNRKDGD